MVGQEKKEKRRSERTEEIVHDEIVFLVVSGLLDTTTNGEDGGLWRVDDGSERRNTKHAEVGHGEGAALVLLREQRALPRLLSEHLHFLIDFGYALLVCIFDDGSDEAIVDRHGHRNVDGWLRVDTASLGIEIHIHLGHQPERLGSGL